MTRLRTVVFKRHAFSRFFWVRAASVSQTILYSEHLATDGLCLIEGRLTDERRGRALTEVAPLSWTPDLLSFRSPQWQKSNHVMRRSSAGR
jgi:hypothetical protein